MRLAVGGVVYAMAGSERTAPVEILGVVDYFLLVKHAVETIK